MTRRISVIKSSLALEVAVTNVQGSMAEIAMESCSHPEADTRIILHVFSYMVSKTFTCAPMVPMLLSSLSHTYSISNRLLAIG